jgi:hypothetical protein
VVREISAKFADGEVVNQKLWPSVGPPLYVAVHVMVWATTVVNDAPITVQGVVEQSFEAVTVTFAAADPTHRQAVSRNKTHLSGYRNLLGNSESFVSIGFSLRGLLVPRRGVADG